MLPGISDSWGLTLLCEFEWMDLLQLTPEAERTCIKDILPRSSKSIGFFLTKQIELANAGTSTKFP